MVLRPAWSIHTAFMRFPIDVVFLDADQVVVRIEADVRSWRTVSCRGAREIVELATGECRQRGLEVGDRVAWASRSAMDARLDRGVSPWEGDASEPRARVLVASRDPRFVRLARFLLGGRDLEVQELTTPERLPDAVAEPDVDLAVLDGGGAVAEALRTANAARARRPEVPVVIAADTGGKSPAGVRVFDRWNETEELLLDIERLLGERLARTAPQDVSDDAGVAEEERPGPFVNR
jgi:CheY-like chemotaxis protein